MWSTRQENQEKCTDLLSGGVIFQLFEEKMVKRNEQIKSATSIQTSWLFQETHTILNQIYYIFLLLHLSHVSQNVFNKVALKGSGYY